MLTANTRYRVRIVYTEPEFQRRTAGAPAEYRFDFDDVPAASPEEAIEAAVRDFLATAVLSRVGWRRCIRSVSILGRSGRV